MKKFAFAFALCFVLNACDDDPEPLTWGELSLQLGESFCAAGSSCGFDVKPGCPDHVRWHQCEPDRSCDVELPAEAQVAMDECDVALMSLDAEECAILFYGFLPSACDPVFGFDPGPQD